MQKFKGASRKGIFKKHPELQLNRWGVLFNKLWQIFFLNQMNLCPKGRDATCVPTARIEKAGKCAINARGMSVENILF